MQLWYEVRLIEYSTERKQCMHFPPNESCLHLPDSDEETEELCSTKHIYYYKVFNK